MISVIIPRLDSRHNSFYWFRFSFSGTEIKDCSTFFLWTQCKFEAFYGLSYFWKHMWDPDYFLLTFFPHTTILLSVCSLCCLCWYSIGSRWSNRLVLVSFLTHTSQIWEASTTSMALSSVLSQGLLTAKTPNWIKKVRRWICWMKYITGILEIWANIKYHTTKNNESNSYSRVRRQTAVCDLID